MRVRTLLALALAALTLSACERASDEAFGQRVRAYLLEHPEVLLEAQTKLREKQAAEAAQQARQAIAKHRAELERDPRDFVANPQGAITVVEFYDYNCGYCKLVAPEIMSLIEENPDIRFVFKELPIFGGESELAARIMLTPQAKPRTLELHQRLMAERPVTTAALEKHLAAVGIDPAAAKAAAEQPEVVRHVADNHRLAEALGIEGTPHFIVGDEVIPGADMAALRQAIARSRAARAG